MSTAEIEVIGKPVKMWVIIDDVFISRFVGVVSEYGFSDNKFTFQCKDRNNSDAENLENYIFGNAYTQIVAVAENVPIAGEALIAFSQVPNTHLRHNDYKYPAEAFTPEEYDAVFVDSYNGFFNSSHRKLAPNTQAAHSFHLAGDYDIAVGMVAKFSTSDKLFLIVDFERYIQSVPGTLVQRTRIDISEMPEGITTYSQYFGKQPIDVDYSTGTPEDIAFETGNIGGEVKKVFVSIYSQINRVDVPDGCEPVTKDGKLVAVNSSGETVLVDYVDGEYLAVSSAEKVEKIVPDRFSYALLNKAQLDTLDAGGVTRLDSFVWKSVQHDMDFNTNNSRKISPSEGIAIMFDVEGETAGFTPCILAKTPHIGTMSWTDVVIETIDGKQKTNFGLYCGEFGEFDFGGQTDTLPQSTIFGGARDQEAVQNAIFPEFGIEEYTVFNTSDYNEIVEKRSSFRLPNVNSANNQSIPEAFYNVATSSGIIRCKLFDSGSIPVTNAPKQAVSGLAIHADTSVVKWYSTRGFDEFGSYRYDYPNETVDFGSTANATGQKKFLFIIRPAATENTPANIEYYECGSSLINGATSPISTATQRVVNLTNNSLKFSLDLCSVGLIKTTAIDPSSLRFAMQKTGLTTLPQLLAALTGETVDLPNRNTWFVGGNISEKQSRFSTVTTLCKQSFIAGFTGRDGSTNFVELGNKG
jgi:hypothetical protein